MPSHENAKHILIVDDEEDMLIALETGLQKHGFSVMQSNNGLEAVRLAMTERPDLIILDVNLPDVEGGQVAASLKASPTTRNIPIIFLTALLPKEEEDRRRGGHKTITKPYDLDDLVAEIHKSLQEAASRQVKK